MEISVVQICLCLEEVLKNAVGFLDTFSKYDSLNSLICASIVGRNIQLKLIFTKDKHKIQNH